MHLNFISNHCYQNEVSHGIIILECFPMQDFYFSDRAWDEGHYFNAHESRSKLSMEFSLSMLKCIHFSKLPFLSLIIVIKIYNKINHHISILTWYFLCTSRITSISFYFCWLLLDMRLDGSILVLNSFLNSKIWNNLYQTIAWKKCILDGSLSYLLDMRLR